MEFIDFFSRCRRFIDRKHIRFLPQEIIVDIAAQDKHIIDILVETYLKNEKGIVVIHVENQSQRIPGYSEKMYRYYNRLYEKYRKKIVPVVVYAHEEKVAEDDTFQIGFSFMTVVRFKYLMVHLVKENWREYIRKDNPV